MDISDVARMGGKARAQKLGPVRLKRAMRKAVQARWAKFYRDNPDKQPKRKTRPKKKAA